MRFKVKNDKYRKARGGYSRYLDISCAKCGAHIYFYQKDGPGSLKRSYMDRILEPEKWSKYQYLDIKEAPNLTCSECGAHIGSPYMYDKEDRKSFIMNQGAFSKKIIKNA